MKSFPWKQFLQQHPIFSTIRDEQKIDDLLADGVSWERIYAKDDVIVSQDDIGNTVFLIGSGSAEALLEVGEDSPIPLSTMKKGEVFGEMAFFEQRPRAATVRAREPCTALEILGSAFQDLLDEFHDIEFKLLLKMSERLRHTNEWVLRLHIKTVDEKLKLFNDRLVTDQRVVDASLKAAQTVFEQTRIRSEEVIASAERSRARLNTAATAVGGFVTVLVALLGLFGWKQVSDIAKHAEDALKMKNQAKIAADSAETVKKAMDTQLAKANESLDETNRKADEVGKLKIEAKSLLDSVAPLREGLIALYRSRFFDALSRGDALDAITDYQQIREAGGLDKLLSLFLGEMERQVVAKARRPRSDQERSSVSDFVNLFQQAVVDAQNQNVVDARKKRRDRLDAYYLLLVYANLTYQIEFEQQHEGPYKGFATRQDVFAALDEYSKSIPKETPPRAASTQLAKRLSGEADKDVLRNLSRLAFVKAGSD